MANEKIMIVDDDLDMLEVLGLYLEKEGFIVRNSCWPLDDRNYSNPFHQFERRRYRSNHSYVSYCP